MEMSITVLLWFSVIGCGLVAGLYFAFSTFIMKALGRIDDAQGVAAMNAINSTILGSPFIPLFFGTTVASAALATVALFRWGEPGAAAMLVGGLIYVLGMFACTIVVNVPLNNELARAGATGGDPTAVWTRYLRGWTSWNHLRTVASTAAAALFLAALLTLQPRAATSEPAHESSPVALPSQVAAPGT